MNTRGFYTWTFSLHSSQFFFFPFLIKMLATEELSSTSKWWDKYCHTLAYYIYYSRSVVTLISFPNSLGLSKKASLAILLAKGHLSSVFYFGEFWLLATDGVLLWEAQQDLRGVLCRLSLVAPFVPIVWEERAPKWRVLAFPAY